MFNKLFAGALALTTALAATAVTADSETPAVAAADAATLIVYRADEDSKSRRLKLDVHVDDSSLGRLKSEDAMVFTAAPGSYVLDTSAGGTQDLVIELKPGSTHYVHAEMAVKGNRLRVKLVEVEEQVAKLQEPVLDAAI